MYYKKENTFNYEIYIYLHYGGARIRGVTTRLRT